MPEFETYTVEIRNTDGRMMTQHVYAGENFHRIRHESAQKIVITLGKEPFGTFDFKEIVT